MTARFFFFFPSCGRQTRAQCHAVAVRRAPYIARSLPSLYPPGLSSSSLLLGCCAVCVLFSVNVFWIILRKCCRCRSLCVRNIFRCSREKPRLLEGGDTKGEKKERYPGIARSRCVEANAGGSPQEAIQVALWYCYVCSTPSRVMGKKKVP